jgi:hypothetical protein
MFLEDHAGTKLGREVGEVVHRPGLNGIDCIAEGPNDIGLADAQPAERQRRHQKSR